jgi:hypothetical protein
MPWTDPSTHIYATGEVVTAATLNTFVEANLMFLYGDTGWTNVSSFTNSWVSVSQPAYILIGRVVYLRGSIGSGTAGASAFTLPAGYRPTLAMSWTVNTNTPGAPNTITIATSGTVTPSTSTNTSLAGITFPVV